MAFCTQCGADVTAGSRFCGSCGSAVGDASDAPTQRMRRPSNESIAVGERRLLTTLRQVTLGEYEVLTEIGRGGMAVVFLAHDIALDRKVAIKVMSPALTLMDADVQTRFKREARTAASLSHPNIIPVYAVREGSDIVYFVMKYIAGRSLESVVRELGPLPIPMLRTIVTQVGSAIGYAHRKGVVHRDVKPANVMLDDEGWVVVTDFGIAKVSEAQALTVTGGVVGTPSYMSPEQCAGLEITGAADQYSLGVVAYEMLTGRPPFRSGTMVNLLYDHCHTPPPPIVDHRPDCAPELADAIMRMLEKDPARRFPSVEEAVLAIGTVSDSQSGAVRTQMVTLAQDGAGARLLESFRTPGSPVPQRAVASDPAAPTTQLGNEQHAPNRSTAPGTGRRRRLISLVLLAVGLPAAGLTWLLLGRPGMAAEGTSAGNPPLEITAPATAAVEPPSPPILAALSVSPERLALEIGESSPARASAVAQDGSPMPGAEILWESSDPEVARVDAAGTVTAIGAGNARLVARSDTVTAEILVTVSAPPSPRRSPPPPASVATVEISPETATLTPGQTARFQPTLLDARGGALAGRTVTWTSTDPAVASVDPTGLVTARRVGTVTIRARSGSQAGTATVTVEPEPVATVAIDPDARTLDVGDATQLSARIVGSAGSRLDRPVTWQSSDVSVASVSDAGEVRAIAPGAATVTATAGGRAGQASITVRAASVQVEPAPSAAEMEARIDARLEAYRRAIEAGDLAAVRRAFPGMPADQENRWRGFFGIAEDLQVTFTVASRTTDASLATVRVRARYRFRADGPQDQTSDFTATFERVGRDWRLIGID
jgi:serine/threonine-protein kinase